jgi:hypothetical protein
MGVTGGRASRDLRASAGTDVGERDQRLRTVSFCAAAKAEAARGNTDFCLAFPSAYVELGRILAVELLEQDVELRVA